MSTGLRLELGGAACELGPVFLRRRCSAARAELVSSASWSSRSRATVVGWVERKRGLQAGSSDVILPAENFFFRPLRAKLDNLGTRDFFVQLDGTIGRRFARGFVEGQECRFPVVGSLGFQTSLVCLTGLALVRSGNLWARDRG